MNNASVARPSTAAAVLTPLIPDEFETLVEQLKEAYPSATDRLLAQAITESKKEIGDSADREQLLRCVRERITA